MDVHIKPSTLYVHECIQNFENINKTQTVEWYIYFKKSCIFPKKYMLYCI